MFSCFTLCVREENEEVILFVQTQKKVKKETLKPEAINSISVATRPEIPR
jgi:hypothetical protein